MATQSEMTQGYPTPAEILSYLADLGVEIPTENYAPWHDELKQFVWTIANASRWAMTLSVYPASSTTFNVRGGDYRWRGVAKTYTPGSAIDPADNDTTYVWMGPDNTIGSGVDGDGWPTTPHLPLAEIDVDSNGVITAVRDRRARELLSVGLAAKDVTSDFMGAGGMRHPLPVRILLGMQDDETWTQEAGTVAPDLENYVLGRQSLKLTAATGSSARAVCTPSAVNSDDVRQIRGNLGVWIRVDTVANLNWIYLELYPDSGVGGSYYKYYPYKQDGPQYNKHALQDGQWHLCWVPATVDTNVWAKTGTPPDYGTATSSPLPVQKMRVSVGANANGNVNVWFGGFLALEPPKAGLIIGFDGPKRSAFDYGCRRMLERGYIGVAHARAATMQDVDHITIPEWQKLYAAGWDCGPHPSDGTAFDETTPAATVAACIAREVAAYQRILGPRGAQAISWLANNGESAACPTTGDKAGDIAKKMCLAARAKSVFGQAANRAGALLNVFWDCKYCSWIPFNWWNIPFWPGSYNSTGWDFSAATEGFLDKTINMRQVANIYIHGILGNGETPDDLNVSEGWFDDLMEYVAEHLAAGDLELLTYSTWQSKVCGRMGSYGCTLDGVPTYIAGGSTRRWPGSPD